MHAGYDLTRLLIGSEGTLGVITEVTLKLHNRPKISYAMRISFDNVVSAAATARDTLGCGVQVGRCELLDTDMVSILNEANQSKLSSKWPIAHTLMYEITGLSDSSVREQMDIVSSIAAKHGGHTVIVATNPAECSALWRMRKEAIWSCMSAYPTKEPMITDVCVPLSGLPEMIRQAKEITGRSKFPCPIVAHAGNTAFHNILYYYLHEVISY
jgi:D-lactate dehydrogenase (cytochrome)